MTTVDEVRKALEAVQCDVTDCEIELALVTEGLKVLDDYAEVKAEYEKALKSRDAVGYRDAGYEDYIKAGVRAGEQQISLLSSILRSAGRIS